MILKVILKSLQRFLIISWCVVTLTFILIDALPSDAAQKLYEEQGISVSLEVLEQKRQSLELNLPLALRYLNYLGRLVCLDLGYSTRFLSDVGQVIISRMGVTLLLSCGALLLTVIISQPMGLVCALRPRSWAAKLCSLWSFVFLSMPNFYLSLLLLYVLGVKLKLVDIIYEGTPAGLIAPMLTLALPLSGYYIRQTASVISEELGQDYVTGLKARGISCPVIMLYHVLPRAAPALITLLCLSFGGLLGGSVIIEEAFSIQGLGTMILEAVTYRDFALIEGYVLWMTAVFVGVNTLSLLASLKLKGKSRAQSA